MGRKEVRAQTLSRDAPRPTLPSHRFARITDIRGGGLFEVVMASSSTSSSSSSSSFGVETRTAPLVATENPASIPYMDVSVQDHLEPGVVMMPPRFKNVVWVKRGKKKRNII